MKLRGGLRGPVHCGELDIFGFWGGGSLTCSPSLGRWLLYILMGSQKLSSPPLICHVTWTAFGGFLHAVVVNPESEGAESHSEGKQDIYEKDQSPFKGEHRKALRHGFALKWLLCHWQHSVLICLKNNRPGHNLVTGCHVCYRCDIVDRATSKNCWCSKHILYILKCFNILPWCALFS